jgi:hypothetical protein
LDEAHGSAHAFGVHFGGSSPRLADDEDFQIARVAKAGAIARATDTSAQRSPAGEPFQLKRKTPKTKMKAVAIQTATVQIIFALLSLISFLCLVQTGRGRTPELSDWRAAKRVASSLK